MHEEKRFEQRRFPPEGRLDRLSVTPAGLLAPLHGHAKNKQLFIINLFVYFLRHIDPQSTPIEVTFSHYYHWKNIVENTNRKIMFWYIRIKHNETVGGSAHEGPKAEGRKREERQTQNVAIIEITLLIGLSVSNSIMKPIATNDTRKTAFAH